MIKIIQLRTDWTNILKKAWSIRLGALAALFSGAEVVIPLFADAFPRNIFAVLSFVAVAGAMWARLVAQRNLPEEARNDDRG